jgi:hypothetical protein
MFGDTDEDVICGECGEEETYCVCDEDEDEDADDESEYEDED